MFESLVISSERKSRKSSRSWWVSLMLHGGILGFLLLAPLVHYSKLPGLQPLTYLAAAPLPEVPAPPAPPPQPAARQIREPEMEHGLPVVILSDPELVGQVPEAPPDSIPDLSSLYQSAGNTGVPLPGIPEGIPGGPVGTEISGVGTATPPPPPAPIRKTPLRVGGTILQASRTRHVQPVYPDLARKSRVQGVVLLEAQIDELGNVRNLRVLRGHPLLNGAAIEAVQQWKYRPTLLNGEPVPVMTTISVVFSLQ